jgi:roadblock/LC7 domain-containing protein
MLARILLALCVAPAFSFLGQMAARWATTGEQFIFILIGILAIHVKIDKSNISNIFLFAVWSND